ncbi:MAG TPA: TauD/TfdA family dioxygenase [Verrucomicrobiota bacterium]|jgi:alpha-ketoglutarate-dependent taurine dioxygenase|nr:TauD/TfdA family dioxygenase [Verrucomicrobiota bacterium]
MNLLTIPGQHEYGGKPFPLAIKPPEGSLSESCEWAGGVTGELSKAAFEHGAVLLRGLPLVTPEDFDAVVHAFGLPNFSYEESLSNAHRINFTPRVFSANEAPPDITIFLHHEMAQTPIYPSKLFFFCQTAADEGGATPICRSDVLWERLNKQCPGFADDCRSKGLKYSNVMPGQADKLSGMGRCWQSTFSAPNREVAEARLANLGYSWEWQANGDLRATTPVLPAVCELGDGRTSFFNQLIAAFNGWKDTRNDPAKAITFGDGTPLDPADVVAASSLADDITFDIPWQDGDFALVDNYTAMHGRRTFRGIRKVLASFVAT